MNSEELDRSDAKLIAQIRQALGTSFEEKSISAVEVQEIKKPNTQPTRPIIEEAIRVADQLLKVSIADQNDLTDESGALESDIYISVKGNVFSVMSDGLELGRKSDLKGIVIEDSRISRRHARFIQIEGGIAVMDLDSTNGTVIIRNKEHLNVGSDPVPLKPGDSIVTLNNYPLAKIIEGTIE